jgi:hypothetical protein
MHTNEPLISGQFYYIIDTKGEYPCKEKPWTVGMYLKTYTSEGDKYYNIHDDGGYGVKRYRLVPIPAPEIIEQNRILREALEAIVRRTPCYRGIDICKEYCNTGKCTSCEVAIARQALAKAGAQ